MKYPYRLMHKMGAHGRPFFLPASSHRSQFTRDRKHLWEKRKRNFPLLDFP